MSTSLEVANEMLEIANMGREWILDHAKEEIRRKMWEELYGEILDKVLELKRTMNADNQDMNSLVEMLEYKE